VCQFGSDPASGVQGVGSGTTVTEAPTTYPSGSVTVCIDVPTSGNTPIPTPWDLEDARESWMNLKHAVNDACSGMNYCGADGDMHNCKPHHTCSLACFPPQTRKIGGTWMIHNCFTFTCKPGATPAGCEDRAPCTDTICNPDFSCTFPTNSDCEGHC
jgi:hypothetical protein